MFFDVNVNFKDFANNNHSNVKLYFNDGPVIFEVKAKVDPPPKKAMFLNAEDETTEDENGSTLKPYNFFSDFTVGF